uniref:Uncharacterized protein n=1 Tax=Glossina palpalis gambiensis TaxID=67801 RepID=A0A1B0B144_9MUSC
MNPEVYDLKDLCCYCERDDLKKLPKCSLFVVVGQVDHILYKMIQISLGLASSMVSNLIAALAWYQMGKNNSKEYLKNLCSRNVRENCSLYINKNKTNYRRVTASNDEQRNSSQEENCKMGQTDQTVLGSTGKQKRPVFEDLTSENNLNVSLIHFRGVGVTG